jgi:3-oxoacyl-[acyl-carrier-protein] synthase II
LYHLAQEYCLEGVNWNLLSYGAGSTLALGESLAAIQRGDADMMLAGGYDSWPQWTFIVLWSEQGWLSRANDQPQSCHRPFDQRRDGSVPGEGAGFVVLESLESARARGVAIRGELRAACTTMAPPRVAEPAQVLANCISRAMDDAGWHPAEVDLVHLNGDATIDGDRWEVEALRLALGDHALSVPVTTLKSASGHLGNASGAVELSTVLEMMKQETILPILNLTEPDPKFPLNFTMQAVAEQTFKRVLLISRGWPDQFATLLIERWDDANNSC